MVTRVMAESGAIVVAGAALATWLAGVAGGLGVLAGGAIAILDFGWLARRVTAASASGATAGFLLAAGLRLAAVAAAAAAVFATGVAHPVALVAGLTVLPCALVANGLRAAREER
jgi:hypothetical protein